MDVTLLAEVLAGTFEEARATCLSCGARRGRAEGEGVKDEEGRSAQGESESEESVSGRSS